MRTMGIINQNLKFGNYNIVLRVPDMTSLHSWYLDIVSLDFEQFTNHISTFFLKLDKFFLTIIF